MPFPTEYKYTKDHEWAKVDGNTITIGITDHAQSELGDIVFVELPEVGRELTKGDTFGAVESVKAVSDLYSPATGKVLETNSSLADNPGTLNQDAHGDGWILKLEVTDPASLEDLMDAGAYEAHVGSGA